MKPVNSEAVTAVTLALTLVSLSSSVVFAKTAEEWKERTIYQLLTDRFSPTKDTTQQCPNLSDYCGGTFQVRPVTLGIFFHFARGKVTVTVYECTGNCQSPGLHFWNGI